jgi:hypothetical protein
MVGRSLGAAIVILLGSSAGLALAESPREQAIAGLREIREKTGVAPTIEEFRRVVSGDGMEWDSDSVPDRGL